MALVVWLGTIIFFSFGVAPVVFTALPVETAGEAVGAIFPRYYGFGLSAGGVLVLSAFGLGLAADAGRRWFTIGSLGAIMFAMTLYAAIVLQPRASALRQALHAQAAPPPGTQEEFDLVHRAAVGLNVGTLILGLGVVGATAAALRH
jgi:uncharacterized membrane protein